MTSLHLGADGLKLARLAVDEHDAARGRASELAAGRVALARRTESAAARAQVRALTRRAGYRLAGGVARHDGEQRNERKAHFAERT